MRVVPEKNAVLINPHNKARLMKMIPSAVPVTVDGRKVLAIPHRLDETRVLNNLGLRVPSPIVHQYEYPRAAFIDMPFRAQIETAGFLTLNPRAFVLNDLGTGKTLAALWAYDYLRRKGLVGKLLVICPLSTMDRAWGDELFAHLSHLKFAVLHGTRAKRLKLLADKDIDVYIVNHHGIKIINDALEKREDITNVVVDEIAQIGRNQSTDIYKAINYTINGPIKRNAWGLTATPIPNDPTDAYAQVRLIAPHRCNKSFRAFRFDTMTQVSQFQWRAKKDAIDKVDAFMQPAIRFHRSQCVDLPPTIYQTYEAPLSAAAEKMYKQMKADMSVQVENGEILAVNEAVKAMKLVQIACGVIYDADHNEVTVDAKGRMQLCVDIVGQSDSKSIVFVPFRSSIKQVTAYIEKAGYSVGVIHGGVSKGARDTIFSNFQRAAHPQVIVAQPGAMSHGLTLTKASTICWYAPITSAEIYEQANGRICRPGQKYTTVIAKIEGTEVERRIYYRLDNKLAMQNILLERKTFREAA